MHVNIIFFGWAPKKMVFRCIFLDTLSPWTCYIFTYTHFREVFFRLSQHPNIERVVVVVSVACCRRRKQSKRSIFAFVLCMTLNSLFNTFSLRPPPPLPM